MKLVKITGAVLLSGLLFASSGCNSMSTTGKGALIGGGGGGALDVAGVPAVADVTREPVVSAHVGERMSGGVQVHLLGAGVAGGQAVDQGGHLGAGDVVAGAEAALVALEDLHAGQHVGGFNERFRDLISVAEGLDGVGGAGGQHEAERHDHRHDQREELLQVSHWIVSSLCYFAVFSQLFEGGAEDEPSSLIFLFLPNTSTYFFIYLDTRAILDLILLYLSKSGFYFQNSSHVEDFLDFYPINVRFQVLFAM